MRSYESGVDAISDSVYIDTEAAGKMNRHNNTMEEESIRIRGPAMDESIHLTTTSNHGAGAARLKATLKDAMGERSVRFSHDDDDGGEKEDAIGVSASRVSFLKEKLKSSFHGDASFQRSWGDGLKNDLSSSSNNSNSEGSDSDNEESDGLGQLPTAMDASENLRERARRESVSFNMSFMSLGMDNSTGGKNAKVDEAALRLMGRINSRREGSNKTATAGRQLASGRGSIFVIADEKFSNTKVVRARLDKAARKLQRFFRRSMLYTRRYNKERIYLQEELADTENRRCEEMSDIQKWIKEEKEQFRVELEREESANQISQEEWDSYDREQEELRQQVAEVKADNKAIKKEGKALIRENDQLELEARNPEREADRKHLEKKVKKLTTDIEDWERILARYTNDIAEGSEKIDFISEKRKAKRADRKKIEKTIKKIVALLEENQAEENPKLFAKVLKLKLKREQKIQLLKQQTAQGMFLEEDQSKQEQAESIEGSALKQRKTKKGKAGELPALTAMNSSDRNQPEATPVETEETLQEEVRKRKKKEKKEKKKREEKRKQQEELDAQKHEEVDATLMMIYAIEEKKRRAEASKQDHIRENASDVANLGRKNRQESALMSLITN